MSVGGRDDDLAVRVGACLDARLQHAVEHPVVLALSGGGDSMALLHIAADWAKARGRRLLAVTVDHALNPDSSGWSETCRHACEALNVAWTERRWTGDKPTTGLPAAARHARHALLADAAREAGAKVILLAHTADDIAEGDWMRERGSNLGTLREWSPSPSWPEGRGLMLLRPMLGEGREALRACLRARQAIWIEDPANADLRFGRSRARHTLTPLPSGEGLSARERQRSDLRERVRGSVPTVEGGTPHPFGLAHRFALRASSPLPLGEGVTLQNPSPPTLSAAIVCTSGGTAIPRPDRIATLTARLVPGQPFTASLSGARITTDGTTVTLTREPGDLRRRPVPDRPLTPGRPAVWDGRYEITTTEPGWTVTAAQGHLAALSPADRAVIRTVAPQARAALPVLIRNDHRGPVLAWRLAEVRALVPRRLDLALSALGMGETTHEADLFRPLHGETPPSDLFSSARHETDARHAVPPKDREPK
ncbi:tRNA(Ile)-lysidine synthase [Brevundimonas sp. NIBR10]|uniref:tRNA lysidine(34) synthetase TilS n=1 Tax=Brevundimonas sp. NIBR10 TaxID=3015997 RepID=UPI0022F1C4B5|nr:tRNA lysidine(34) synthetase TilS [Brevundimonas sp. NIBR10]WGM46147.1 tRNA(Ile)-lysidine synthase [Brevundimonas sp. NIBR10]